MIITSWISNNWIEIFGAVAGIVYVFLEVRQNLWLWPVGIVTSAFYIWVFFTGKLYADMSLQGYYLVISCLGLYWWIKGSELRAQSAGYRAQGSELRAQSTGQISKADSGIHGMLKVTRVNLKLGLILLIIFLALFSVMYFVLDRFTDSPVPGWDSFITSLSVVATWMLARKIFEHWYLWIVVNSAAVVLFITRGLYPTVVLYLIYFIMSFIGLREWRRSMNH
ncbi:MAG TPA: nicotinamide riboside transporter PnuC [Bacteroidales bacterium]|nr:nicotinamide riboside transporter PnuC [Bacteroidales bacterium]